MNFQKIPQPNTVEVLRQYAILKSLSASQLAGELVQFSGWSGRYTENYINQLFIGRMRPQDEDVELFRLFFAYKIYNAVSMS